MNALLDAPETPRARVLDALLEQLRLRAWQPAFHPNAMQFTMLMEDRVLGVWRQSLDRHQSVFALHNVSNPPVEVPLTSMNLVEDESWFDLLGAEPIDSNAEAIALAPYQCRWISTRS